MKAQECRTRSLTYLEETVHALAMTDAKELILPLIVDRIARISESDAIAVLGVEPERGEFRALAIRQQGRTYRPEQEWRIPRQGTLLDRALTERAPIPLIDSRPAMIDPIIQYLLAGERLVGGYIIPLRVAGAERGGLLIVNPRESGASWELLRELTPFGDLAAVAIDRSQLRRNRSDDATRLRVLNAVLRVTSSGLEEESLIQRALDALLAVLPADCMELVTSEGGEFRTRYRYGLQLARRDGADDAWRSELHRRVLEVGDVVYEKSDGEGRGGRGLRLICVPLRGADRIVGTMLLGRHSVPYEREDGELLTAVGRHLGDAIELSRLMRRQATEAESLERALAEASQLLKETRDRLAAIEEERNRIQSLASLGELAAGVAHDLNNALNPVVAFAELIQEHSTQPERVRMYADRILLAARGGAETVRRIQRYTRRRLGGQPLESISVATLVEEVVALTRPTWSKPRGGGVIEIERSIDPDLLIQGNPGELRQALLNLVGNALDAMPGGGVLRFVARGEGEEVLLSVQDTGCGMPKAVYERALEPFFTTKRAHGTGLGLAEVFGIARRHGGSLELESFERVGTTVTLRLPRTDQQPAPARERRTMAEAATRLYHILLVDDNLLNLEATAAALRAAGHTVATAPNGHAALRVFNAGHYDLVLTDLGLPDMHGLELVDRLRRLDPDVRVGVITGWTIHEGEEELQRRGIDLLFVKPIDTDQLLAAL